MRARFWLTIGVAAIAVATGCKLELPATVAPGGDGKIAKATPKPSTTPTAEPDAEPDADVPVEPPQPGTRLKKSPVPGPVEPAKPSIEPFRTDVGHIRGRVIGQAGFAQPIGLAFVTTGEVSTFTANPREDEVVEEDGSNADKDQISVGHDFDGEEGPGEPELALRLIRKRPPTPDEADRYVYLRPGEFFLEGVPAGEATVTASFGNVTTPGSTLRVYPNTIVEDVVMRLQLPEPILQNPDGTVPPIVEWSQLDPPNGVSVSVVSKRTTDDSGQVFLETSITYKPDPPDVAVTLKAPPGSPGTVIQAYEISYEYTTPNLQKEGKPPVVVGPSLIPTPPLIVPPAGETAFGPPIVISVPVGSRALNDIFGGGPDDQPALVVATVEFKDDKGFPVPGKDLNPLKVSIPLRAL